MIHVDENVLEVFRRVKDLFLSNTKLPRKDFWRSLDDNEIWLHVVKQVIVVGASRPAKKLDEKPGLKEEINYHRLTALIDEHEDEVEDIIRKVLLNVGARFYRNKARALTWNLRVLKMKEGSPRLLLVKLSEMKEEMDRVRYLVKNFKYIKRKGARDLLIELGLAQNVIALDQRIINILEKLDINFDKKFVRKDDLYCEVEKELISKICKPLGLSGAQFDRMLYQNYDSILSFIEEQLKQA